MVVLPLVMLVAGALAGGLSEVEVTQNLIELYEQKIALIGQLQQVTGPKKGLTLEENTLKLITKEREQEAQAPSFSNLQVSQFIEKAVYESQGEKVTAFEFITLKPLGRSPQNHMVPYGVALSYESGIVSVFDTHSARNLLFQVVIGKDILQVGSSGVQDDMFLAVLTADAQVHIYEITIERKASELPQDGVQRKQRQDETQVGIKIYEYRATRSQIIDLRKAAPTEKDLQYSSFVVASHKGDRYLVVADNQGSLQSYKERSDKQAIFEFKGRFFSGVREPIIGLSKSQQTVLFVQRKRLGFLRAADGALSSHSCHVSGRGIDSHDFLTAHFELHTATVTGSGSIHATTRSGEVLIFETQGTIIKPELLDCKLIERHKSPLATQQGSLDVRLIKGGFLLHHSDGTFAFYNQTFQSRPEVFTRSPIKRAEDVSPFAEVRLASTGTSLVLARVPGSSTAVALIEVLNPYMKSDSMFDVSWLSSLRMPLFLIGFVCVVMYQVYQKRQKSQQEEASKDAGSIAKMAEQYAKKSGKPLTAKMKKDLAEIGTMEKKIKGLSSKFD